MNSHFLLRSIRQELKQRSSPLFQKSTQRFFKNAICCYGVRTGVVRSIAKKYHETIRQKDKEEVFLLCKELFSSGFQEESVIATQWLVVIKNRWEEGDFEMFCLFFETVDNWSKCDDFCLRVLSCFILHFPQHKEVIKKWAYSKNLWKRRVSAVSCIQGGKKWEIDDSFFSNVFEIATILLNDSEDLVQKGYGWMLKVTSEKHPEEVFSFLEKNSTKMPRTAFRYALEKMPPEIKRKAMGQEN